jgi:predicted dehydrogenase
MKVLIIGAGRMGLRHLQGVLSLDIVEDIMILDIKDEALTAAKALCKNDDRVKYGRLSEFNATDSKYDLCIIASTASSRKPLCEIAVNSGCKYLLIEKPLGQSYQEVENLCDYLDTLPLETYVNLNMRMYDSFIKLKKDINSLTQFDGEKIITINTGTIGIGCNGIHYLDLLYFLLEADTSEIISAEVDDNLIPSGRGKEFFDFGGWAVIKFYRQSKYVGKCLLSLSSGSTVFGSWDFVGPYGKISVDEISQKRVDTLRKEDSQMPISRYAADFLEPVEHQFTTPFLGDLTAKWIQELNNGNYLLPHVRESLKVHKLMFDWLSKSNTYKNIFPIT